MKRIVPAIGRHAGLMCIVICAGYAVAGFWPFDFRPENRVSRLPGGPGLRFDTPSVVYSEDAFALSAAGASRGVTIEFDLRPAHEPVWEIGSILSIVDGPSSQSLEIAQYGSRLLVRTRRPGATGRQWYREDAADAGLLRNTRRTVVLSSGDSGTSVYVDGSFAAAFAGLRLDAEPPAGRLLVGIDVSGHRNWEGKLYGIAVFGRLVDARQAASHSELWRSNRKELLEQPGLCALYLFDEKVGSVVRDHAGSGPSLMIPEYFRLPYRRVLVAPALEWKFSYAHMEDVAVNILGFVPLGFFAYFWLRRRGLAVPAGLVGAVLLAGLVSLGIELVQVWLPMRSSSMKDLICNVSGAAVGALAAKTAGRHWGSRGLHV